MEELNDTPIPSTDMVEGINAVRNIHMSSYVILRTPSDHFRYHSDDTQVATKIAIADRM